MTAASMLSELEPIFGASLAINLAYLNLNQFRYRNEIALEAHEKTKDAPANIRNTIWFLQIASLAKQANGKKEKLKLPFTIWALLYRVLFQWEVDKYASAFFTAASVAYLFLGVAFQVGEFSELISKLTSNEIVEELFIGLLGLVWPMCMILSAMFCRKRCLKFISYQMDQVGEDEMKQVEQDIENASQQIDVFNK